MGIEFPNSVRAGNDIVQARTAEGISNRKLEALQRMVSDGDLNDNIAELAGKDGQLTAEDLQAAGFDPIQSRGLAQRLNAGGREAPQSLARQLGGRDAVSLDEVARSRPEYARSGINGLTAQLNAIPDPMQRDAVITELATDAAALSLRADTLGAADDTIRKVWQALGLPQRHDESGVRLGEQVLPDFQQVPSADTLSSWCRKHRVSKDAFAQAVLSHPDIPINDRKALLRNVGLSAAEADNRISARQDQDLLQIRNRAAGIGSTMGASTPCQTLTLATGNGTGTAGIGGRRNVGAGYFQTPDIRPTAQRVFTPEDATRPVVMRFNAVGVDENAGIGANDTIQPNTMTMRVGGQTFEFDVLKTAAGGNAVVPRQPEQLQNNPLVQYHAETNSLTIAPGAGPIAFEQRSTWVPVNNRPDAELDADEFQVSVTTYNANSVQVEVPRVSLPLEDTFQPDRFTVPDFANEPSVQQMADYLQQFPVSQVQLDLTGLGAVNLVGDRRVPTTTETTGYAASGPESRSGLAAGRHAEINGTLSEDRQTLQVAVSASTDHVRSGLFSAIGNASGPNAQAAQERLRTLRTANPGLTGNQLLSALRSIAIEQGVRQALSAKGVDTSHWPAPAATVGGTTVTLADFQAFNAVVP